ncbi:MAG: GTPase Der [Porticoccaceae bacterium]|nr:MAG: GTPase Der [Porticoccaceae bacterium]
MLPIVALVGRPNVGKSTLFNRLTRSRAALVADYPGLTRDRLYGEAEWRGRRFAVVDTGGLAGEEEGLEGAMAGQAWLAVREAQLVLFLVDARAGLTAADQAIAERLRAQGKPFLLVVNKVDGLDPDQAAAEFHALGCAAVLPVSAAHGRGVQRLLDALRGHLPAEAPQPTEPQEDGAPAPIRVAVVGRPNVGKSTLVNRLLGEERVVVYDLPGTTRDSIYVDFERHGRRYTLIDTAGVRRRRAVREAVEKFSIVKTLQAIDEAHVVLLLVDAREGIVDQDLHLLGYVLDAGRALVVAVNKWDGLDPDHKTAVRAALERRLRFADFAEVRFISALHGTGVGDLFAAVERAYAAATAEIPTHRLSRILAEAVADHPPPAVRGRRIKLRYAHLGGRNPPVVVIHGNQTEAVPAHYTRYLEKRFREALGLVGTPLRIEYRTAENPFAGRRNELTPRQIAKRRRLLRHVKRSGR